MIRPEREPWPLLSFLFLVGLACRVWFLWTERASPFAAVPIVDAREYHLWASSIASGQGLLAVWAHHSPIYPLFLAVFYKVFGGSPWPVFWFQALLGALTAVLCGHAAWKAWQDGPASVAAGLAAAAAWPFLYPAGQLLPQALEMFLAALSVWLLSGLEQPGGLRALASGCALGAVCSLRPQLAPAGLLAAAALRFSWPRCSWKPALCFAVPVLGLSLAWGAYLTSKGIPALLQTRSGLNLYIANHPGAAGSAADYPGLEFAVLKQKAAVAGAGGPAQDSFFMGRVLEWLKADPAGFFRLFLRRLVLNFSNQEIPAGEAHPWAAEGAHPFLRRLDFGILLGLGLPGVALGGALASGVLRPAAVFLASGFLFLAVGGAAARYRAPLLPFLALGSGYSFLWLKGAISEGRPRRAALMAAALAGTWLAAFWAGKLAENRPLRELAIALSFEAREGGTQAQRSLGMLEAWAVEHPEDWDCLWHLGLMEVHLRDWKSARTAFSRLADVRGQDLPQLHGIAAWLSAMTGDLPSAARASEAAFRKDPGSLENCLRAVLYAKLADPATAVVESVRACPLDPVRRRPAHPAAEELAAVVRSAEGPGPGFRVDFQAALSGVEEAYWEGWEMGYPAERLRAVIFSRKWPLDRVRRSKSR